MPLDAARARVILDRAASIHVLVLGDVMLDHFLVGRVDRISPEAPVPIVEFQREQFRLGGAANVASNVRELRAGVEVVGVVGDDPAGIELRRQFADRGISDAGLVVAAARPTTRKVRIVTTRNQQVARVDYESDADVTGSVEDDVLTRLGERVPGASVVVVSDYLKGVVTLRVMRFLAGETASRHIPLLVDPKIPHLGLYRGATLVTPNHHEAQSATGWRVRTLPEVQAAAREFRWRAGCESVLVTWGEHGMWLLEGRRSTSRGSGDRDGVETVSENHLPAVAREVADVTGAGDTVIASMAVALAGGAGLSEAASLANHAAGIAVGRFGPATVSADELVRAFAAPLPANSPAAAANAEA